MRSRDSVLLEFDQLLNLLFDNQATADPWLWKESPYEGGVHSFCRDARVILDPMELRQYAVTQWLNKRGLEKRDDVRQSLVAMLDAQLPLRN